MNSSASKELDFIPPSPLKDWQILAAKRGELDWRSLVYDPASDDLVSLPSTAPGRPRTFLKNPELKTAPFSCEIIKYNNDLYNNLLCPLSRFLRCGAGVKVILDDYQKPKPARGGFEWCFYLDDSHPDFDKMTPEQREYFVIFPEEDADLVVTVADSMEEPDSISIALKDEASTPELITSIESSWDLLIQAARAGDKIMIDLSRLRPYGVVNSKSLMASGPIGLGKEEKETDVCSFFSIYKTLAEYLTEPSMLNFLMLLGTINDTLRRGGFKRGIVTSGMDWRNVNFEEYLDVPLELLPGGHKKGARLSDDFATEASPQLFDKVVQKRNSESLFLAKILSPNFFDNVCMGLGVPDFGTCLIWRLNLGKVEVMSDIPGWMVRAVTQLTLLHLNWRKERPEIAKIVAPQERDLQIGLDIMGMANALAKWGITYYEFNQSIKAFLQYSDRYTPNNCLKDNDLLTGADRLVYFLAEGYKASTKECDRICDLYLTPHMQRIHTAAEPAQSHSYETTDTKGYTTCRAIYPAIGKSTRKGVKVRRVSSHQANVMANHGFVETVTQVTPELSYEFCGNFNAFIKLTSGRSHDYFSLDTYQEMTRGGLLSFLQDSRIHSLYYAEHNNYQQQYLSKSAPSLVGLKRNSEECAVCAE
jgi:hypothetical protein